MINRSKPDETRSKISHEYRHSAPSENGLDQYLEQRLKQFETQLLQSVEDMIQRHLGGVLARTAGDGMAYPTNKNTANLTGADMTAHDYGSPSLPPLGADHANFNQTLAGQIDNDILTDPDAFQLASQFIAAAVDQAIQDQLFDATRDGGVLNRGRHI